MIKFIVTILLLSNCIGALYGGLNLILYPDGSTIQLSPVWLKHTPFTNYLIPGIILFIVNGLFSFASILAMLFNWRNYFYFILAQGVMLFGWIAVQVIMIQTIHFLHIMMGIIAILLVALSLRLKKTD